MKQQKKWNYAEGILKQWINHNVKTLKDVDALETEYQRNKGVKNVSESIGRVMTRIVNTSACVVKKQKGIHVNTVINISRQSL